MDSTTERAVRSPNSTLYLYSQWPSSKLDLTKVPFAPSKCQAISWDSAQSITAKDRAALTQLPTPVWQQLKQESLFPTAPTVVNQRYLISSSGDVGNGIMIALMLLAIGLAVILLLWLLLRFYGRVGVTQSRRLGQWRGSFIRNRRSNSRALRGSNPTRFA